MGGRLTIGVTVAPGGEEGARRRAGRVAARLDAWARRLTRFDETSELARLNRDPRSVVPAGPTLARALDWAAEASALTGGLVTPTLLAERLAAERGTAPPPRPAGAWSVHVRGRQATVARPAGIGMDLDGIAKGWLADRALRLLRGVPGAFVDADGDIAIRVAPGDEVLIGVADPRGPGDLLTALRLATGARPATFGIATSGTTVHRWPEDRDGTAAATRHHLIDPHMGRPAITDITQATVLAATAAEAEVLAKAALILGQAAGTAFLDQRGAYAAVLLTTAGACVATTASLPWLVAA